jgi:hypothetical protein
VGRSPNTELVKSILEVLALTFGLNTDGNGPTKQRRMGGMVEGKYSFVCVDWQASSGCSQCIAVFQDESKIHHLRSDLHIVLCPRDQARGSDAGGCSTGPSARIGRFIEPEGMSTCSCWSYGPGGLKRLRQVEKAGCRCSRSRRLRTRPIRGTASLVDQLVNIC